jgi:hypothetical protein
MMRLEDGTRRPGLATLGFALFIGLGMAHIIRHLCIAIGEGRLPPWPGP